MKGRYDSCLVVDRVRVIPCKTRRPTLYIWNLPLAVAIYSYGWLMTFYGG